MGAIARRLLNQAQNTSFDADARAGSIARSLVPPGGEERAPRSEILVLLVTSAGMFFCSSPRTPNQKLKPTQYEVEAAYLFNFGNSWSGPARTHTSQAPFLICVLGDDPFGPVLDRTDRRRNSAGQAGARQTHRASARCDRLFHPIHQ